MKITYTGQTNLSAAQQKKLDAKFVKVGKLLDRGGEREAHVILTAVRHLQRTEITVRYYDHELVGLGSNTDVLQSITGALEKIEKQILRLREKWRDTKRTPVAKAMNAAPAPVKPAAAPVKSKKPQAKAPARSDGASVVRVNHSASRKPMTLDEAMLELDDSRDYVSYRDATTDRVHVLVRRRDGNVDLIEA